MNSKGFTIVELVVIIIVIGILAMLASLGFNSYRAESINNQRVADTTSISEALEKYYEANGQYPGCSTLAAATQTVRTQTLVGIDENALISPSAPDGTTNSIKCTGTPTKDDDFYLYTGDASTDCTGEVRCLSYTLSYFDTKKNALATITSRHGASPDTTTTVSNFTATTTCYNEVNLSWSATSGAVGYSLQRATNNTFTSNLVESTVTSNSHIATNLTTNTTYYFRVKPNVSTLTNWSSVISSKPLPMAISQPTPIPYEKTVGMYWARPVNTTCSGSMTRTYTVQIASNSTFTSGLETSSVTDATPTMYYMAPGPRIITTYYMRVNPVVNGTSLGWSNTVNIAPHNEPNHPGGGT